MPKEENIWTVDIDGDHGRLFSADELAKAIAETWHQYRKYWRLIADSWRPDLLIYAIILGVDRKELENTDVGFPEIQVVSFKDRLLAMRFGNPNTGSGRSAWKFAYRTVVDSQAPFVVVEEGAGMVIDRGSGKIIMTNVDLTFSSGDGIWPWPIVFPERFLAWGKLRSILTPDDANPLTGLLTNKKDPPARALAVQLQRQLTSISEEWAKEIVEHL